MRNVASVLLALFCGLYWVGIVYANPTDDALAVYQSGDFAKAAALLRPQAEQGDAKAQAALYRIYWYGKGTSIDFPRALKWARSAASLGSADGEYGVAMAYAFGVGVDRNPAEGLKWLKKSAADGSREADAWLAAKYLYGDDVPSNTDLGLHYLQLAADQRLSRALVALADIREQGSFGQIKDSLAAEALREKAAEERFFPAQLDLAISLANTDPVQAAMWSVLATTTGCNAGGRIDQLLLPHNLSAEDRQKAASLAAQWDKSHPPVDLNQFDQTVNICELNRQHVAAQTAAQPSEEPPKQDMTGKGAVLCVWLLYAQTQATVDVCGLPISATDTAIRDGIGRIDRFIIQNSTEPVTQAQLSNSEAIFKNQQITRIVQPGHFHGSCDGKDIAPFRQGNPEEVEKSIDALLSIPREPLMNPCL